MRLALRIQENVTRLDVAVENAMLMGVMNRAGNGGEEFAAADRKRLAPDDFASWPPSTSFMLK